MNASKQKLTKIKGYTVKKLLVVMIALGFATSAMASDERVDALCKNKDIKNVDVCTQVISEQLDAAYSWGERNAHLYKREKEAKLNQFKDSSPMVSLCTDAPNKERCEMLRNYMIEEYKAGIGLR